MLDQALSERVTYRSGAIMLLLLAAWLYWRAPLDVPPGLEMDELIEAQIAEQIIQGDLRPFYEAGQGREGLYHYWLAAWLLALGKHLFTIRIASTTLSLLGLAAVYQFIRQLLGPRLALLALGFAVSMFWTLFSARSGLRSTALPLLAALSGICFWRGLSAHRRPGEGNGRGSLRSALLLATSGLFMGLSFYAYTAARVLPALFLAVLLYLFLFHRKRLSGLANQLLLWAAVALLLILPFWRYLQAHPEADQFAFMEFNRPLAALEQGDPEPAVRTTLATLGMFFLRGDPLIFDNVPGRPVFTMWLAPLFFAGVGIALWRWRQPAYFLVLAWLAISLVPGMLSQPAPNFYRTVAAQVVVPVFPAVALVSLANLRWIRKKRIMSKWLMSGAIGLFVALQLADSWRAYFVEWPETEGISFFWQKGLLETARFLDAEPGVSDIALCTVLTYEYDPWWRPAWQSMPYLMRREHQRIRYHDCRSSFILPGAESSHFVYTEPPIAERLLPAPLETYWGDEAVLLENAISGELGYVFRLARPAHSVERATAFTRAWLAPEVGDAEVTLPVHFGDSLLLQTYHFQSDRYTPGDRLSLVTHWVVAAQPPPRLALFSHLLSDPTTVLAQQDGLSITSHSLQPGDQFWVLHDQIPLPSDITGDSLLLSIGIYSQDTMVRLPVRVGGQPSGDRLFLQMPQLVD